MKQNKKDILDRLNNGDPGFSLPENYFDEFEKNLKDIRKKQKSGFVTSENYFDAFEEKMLFRLETNTKTTTGFKTPDNYFKNIDKKIFDNSNIEKPNRAIKLNTTRIFKILTYSIAASLLLFFSLKSLNSTDNAFDIETIEISEIESWMEEDLISFSSYDISETFDGIYLNENSNFSEDEIEDYLDGANIENLIIEN